MYNVLYLNLGRVDAILGVAGAACGVDGKSFQFVSPPFGVVIGLNVRAVRIR